MRRLPWEHLDCVHAVKVTPFLKRGTTQEQDEGAIGLIGEMEMPVFRGKVFDAYHVSYLNKSKELPLGAILIGPAIDLVACAWTLALTSSDRALLEGMRISIGFLPEHTGIEPTGIEPK